MIVDWIVDDTTRPIRLDRIEVRFLLSVGLKVFMDARSTVTAKEGDRYPLGPPRIIAPEALLAMRRICNPEIVCSIQTGSTSFYAACKSTT